MSTKHIPGIGTITKRNYAYGAAMLTLRTRVGLTQAELAQEIGISRRAVGEWEAGNNYPNATHLQAFIALAVIRGAFSVGHEVEEICSLWEVAHQKVLLDEQWIASLLPQSSPHLCIVAQEAAPVVVLPKCDQDGWDDDAWMEKSLARPGKARVS